MKNTQRRARLALVALAIGVTPMALFPQPASASTLIDRFEITPDGAGSCLNTPGGSLLVEFGRVFCEVYAT